LRGSKREGVCQTFHILEGSGDSNLTVFFPFPLVLSTVLTGTKKSLFPELLNPETTQGVSSSVMNILLDGVCNLGTEDDGSKCCMVFSTCHESQLLTCVRQLETPSVAKLT
jgi:hypothetical protein